MVIGYSEILLEHARHPHNLGVDQQATNIGQADLAGRPPVVEIFLRIQQGKIDSAKFQASGCGVTIACGSVLTSLIEGKTVEQGQNLSQHDLIDALDGVPPHKLYCVDVAMTALKIALPKTK
jgi:nitrogen fixation NifU-like protein